MADNPIQETEVRQTLANFKDPETGRSIEKLQQVQKVQIDGNRVSVTVGLTTWSAPLWDDARTEIIQLLQEKFAGAEVSVEIVAKERPAERQGELGVPAKSIIAVGSGKGGVGKSSVAAYLAYGLSRAGCKVGILDADIYGPSIPHLVGAKDRPTMVNERIQPIEVGGVKIISMGLLVQSKDPVIWRGPMLHTALTQFLRDTDWVDVDYLIIDMPPGTGDIPLSLSQLIPLTGAVVVCTPQDVALLDAVKAVAMFRKVNIDVLGMVENMSFFLCPECNSRHDIFGTDGAKKKAQELSVPLLGEIPLNTALRVLGDEGRIAAAFDNETARPYLEAICLNLVKDLATRHREQPSMPSLSILS